MEWELGLGLGKRTLVLTYSCGSRTETSSECCSTPSDKRDETDREKEAGEMEEWANKFADLLDMWIGSGHPPWPLTTITASAIAEFRECA